MNIDRKSLVIGLLLGVCTMLAMAPAEAPHKLDADYRYQITAAASGQGYMLFVLDHETKKIYQREVNGLGSGGIDVKRIVGGN